MTGPLQIRVNGRAVKRRGDVLTVSFQVEGVEPNRLVFEVSDTGGSFLSEAYDAALLALLIPAMDAGRSLRIEGPVSARLMWNVERSLMDLLRLALPRLSRISVSADELTTGASTGEAVVTGLSGGVDSLVAALEHVEDPACPPDMRVTHFVFHAGSRLTNTRQRSDMREARWERCRRTAEEIGRPIIRVTSNVDDFYDISYRATHTMRSASVPLLLGGGVRRWFYASGFPYSEIRARPSYDMARIDPLLLPLLTTESTALVSTGSNHKRSDKTRKIADYPLAWRYLYVCVRTERNCSKCWKCLRTLLTLELLGKLERFGEVFDLDTYAAERDRYLVQVLHSPEPLLGEIRDLMAEVGFRPRPTLQMRAGGARVASMVRRTGKTIIRQPSIRKWLERP